MGPDDESAVDDAVSSADCCCFPFFRRTPSDLHEPLTTGEETAPGMVDQSPLLSPRSNARAKQLGKVVDEVIATERTYVADLELRTQFFARWVEGGIPKVFWLSGIFFTHALLTGSMQNYARKAHIPIDLLVFDFEMLPTAHEKDVPHAPEDGIYVHGLFLEGACWNFETKELDEAQPKVLYAEAPVMWFRPCHKDETSEFPHYPCPMYRTAERRGTLMTTGHSTNFVMRVLMPSNQAERHWVKRGVAILCSLSF